MTAFTAVSPPCNSAIESATADKAGGLESGMLPYPRACTPTLPQYVVTTIAKLIGLAASRTMSTLQFVWAVLSARRWHLFLGLCPRLVWARPLARVIPRDGRTTSSGFGPQGRATHLG